MGIMDRLRGRRAEEAAPVDESSLSAAMHASPSGVDLSEAPPLPVASPSSSHGDPFAMSVDQSARFYNPYEGMSGVGGNWRRMHGVCVALRGEQGRAPRGCVARVLTSTPHMSFI